MQSMSAVGPLILVLVVGQWKRKSWDIGNNSFSYKYNVIQNFAIATFSLFQRPYFWKSQSLLSSGQTCRVLSQREMQWKWKAWLQTPQATVQPSLEGAVWLAWHSIHESIIWFLQIAQLSTTISHAHNATAFHLRTSNFFLGATTTGVEEEEGVEVDEEDEISFLSDLNSPLLSVLLSDSLLLPPLLQ